MAKVNQGYADRVDTLVPGIIIPNSPDVKVVRGIQEITAEELTRIFAELICNGLPISIANRGDQLLDSGKEQGPADVLIARAASVYLNGEEPFMMKADSVIARPGSENPDGIEVTTNSKVVFDPSACQSFHCTSEIIEGYFPRFSSTGDLAFHGNGGADKIVYADRIPKFGELTAQEYRDNPHLRGPQCYTMTIGPNGKSYPIGRENFAQEASEVNGDVSMLAAATGYLAEDFMQGMSFIREGRTSILSVGQIGAVRAAKVGKGKTFEENAAAALRKVSDNY